MTTPDFKRKLSAILMADVVGYSRLMGEDEAATLKTLSTYHGIMFGLIKQHRGRVVESPGDAVLAEFTSVVDAVQCAVAVQKELQNRNAELPENRRMQFRIGINLGDVIEEGDKIYGDGVNIAARLEALADPGGICISRTAFDHIETKLPLGYEFLGEKTVKNIARPVGAYRVLLEPRVTVVGEMLQEKTQSGWPRKALVAAGLVMFTAAISLAVWKSGWFTAPPEKQVPPPSPQAPPSPLTQVTPSPPVFPPPQATAPTKVVPVPEKPDRAPGGPLSKRLFPTPVTPSPEPVSRPRVLPLTPGRGVADFLKQLDANNDGKVSLAEFTTWRERQFDALDKDKDGSLSGQEVAAGETKLARSIRQKFELLDTNQDQRLSREEFRAGGRRRFLMFDADKDGHLSLEELVSLLRSK